MVKRIIALLISLLLIGCLSMTVMAAHPVPDLTKNGSITFVMDWEGEPMDGGNLNLYKVGQIAEDDGNYGFRLIEEMEGSELTLESIGDPVLAEELLTLAKVLKLTARTAPIREGTARFQDLAPGLYVAWQDKADATKGFAPISPFLISIPKFQNDTYILDVIAQPKVPLETVPPTTKPPPPEELPQTGQLNWPVPVMGIGGAVLLILGFVLHTSGKKEQPNA